MHTSYDVLEYILSHEECDVDPINRLDRTTPLHLAVVIEDPKVRKDFVESLLDAGADHKFVRLILRFSTVTMITTCDLDTGYGINMGIKRWTS